MRFANKIFGENLKFFRKGAGFTQWNIADKVNTDSGTVSRWESGEFLPDDEKFELICRILNRKPEEFFNPHSEVNSIIELLMVFRELNDVARATLLDTARGLLGRNRRNR